MFTLTQGSTFGGGGKQITWSFVYDTIPPGVLTGIAPVTSVGTPLVTGTSSVTITGAAGSCEPGAIVTVTQVFPAAGPGPHTTTCASDGSFSLTVVRPSDAAYQFAVNQVDLAGNPAAAAVDFYWTRDTAIPDPPASIAVTTPAPLNASYLPSPVSVITVDCVVGNTVSLFENGSPLSVTPDSDCTGVAKAFTVTGTSTTDGTLIYSAIQTKPTGVDSAERTATYTLDQANPAAPGIGSPVAVGTGGSGSYTSAETSITLTGSCETGATVSVTGGDSPANVTCTAGSYTFASYAGAAGPHTLAVTQQDLASNASTATTLNWTSGASVPAAPTIGTPGTNPYLSQTLASISGTCTIGVTSVDLAGSQTGSTTCPSGTYSFTITDPGTDNTYTYSVTQTDVGGTSGAATLTWIRDTVALAPALTKPVVVSAGGSGAHNTGAVNSIAIEGSCEADATVNITGAATKAVTCGPGGTFSTTVNAFQDGAYNYGIKQTDLAGNISATTSLTWTRTTSTPAAPTITTPSQETTYSNQKPTVILGNCTADYTLVLSGAQTDGTTCTTSGQFNFTLAPLPDNDGTYTFYVSQADAVGTTSPTAIRIWVYDTLKPAALVITNPTQTPSVTANATQFLLAGACETDATVTLGGTVSAGEVTPGNSLTQTCTGGQFSYTISKSAPVPGTDDTYSFSLLQTDRAGNGSASITQGWINTAALLVTPSITSPASFPVRTNNGVVAGSPLVPAPNGEVVIQGSCEYDPAPPANSLNRVFLDDGLTDMLEPAVLTSYPYQIDCGVSGTFSISLANQAGNPRWVWNTATATGGMTGSWTNSTYGFTAFQQKIDNTDTANPVQTNRSAGVFFQVIVDQTAPAAPALTAPVVLASGGNNSGSPHAGPGPINLAGTCEANAEVFYASSGGGAGSKPCASGAFSFTGLNEATDGTYVYAVWQVDRTGNISTNTELSWLKDSQLVPPPTITVPDTNPFISGVDTLTMNGTCAAQATVVLTQVSPGGQPDKTTGCSGGSFSFSVGPYADDIYDFTLHQDIGGTLSGTVDFQWVLDSTAPIPEADYALPFDPIDPSGVGSDLGLVFGNPIANPAHDAVFEYHEQGGDLSATFECNLDGTGFAACTSPLVYSGLAPSVTHSLVIRAKDAAGNLTLPADQFQRYWVQQAHSTVALYHFNETGTAQNAADDTQYKIDSPPYQYDGFLTAVGTVGVAGVFGNARSLDNDAVPADRLHVVDQPHLGSLRTRMTMETWVKLSMDNVTFIASMPGTPPEMVLASKWDPINLRPLWEFGLRGKAGGNPNRMHNTQLYFRTYTQVLDASGAVVVSTTPVEAISANLAFVPKGTAAELSTWVPPWVHLAVVWNRGVVTFFEDGVQSGNPRVIGISGLSLLPDGAGDLQIGAVQATAGPTFAAFLDGGIDELRISQDLCYVVGPGAAPAAPFTNADCDNTGQ